MARVSVRIKKDDLPAIAKALPEAADVIVQSRGQDMVEAAARRSRVDTGAMRDGWTWEKTGQGEGRLTNPVPYTVFHELGTSVMSSQPMARPAFDEVAPQIVYDFADLERLLA